MNMHHLFRLGVAAGIGAIVLSTALPALTLAQTVSGSGGSPGVTSPPSSGGENTGPTINVGPVLQVPPAVTPPSQAPALTTAPQPQAPAPAPPAVSQAQTQPQPSAPATQEQVETPVQPAVVAPVANVRPAQSASISAPVSFPRTGHPDTEQDTNATAIPLAAAVGIALMGLIAARRARGAAGGK
jgi:hypothetical protein